MGIKSRARAAAKAAAESEVKEDGAKSEPAPQSTEQDTKDPDWPVGTEDLAVLQDALDQASDDVRDLSKRASAADTERDDLRYAVEVLAERIVRIEETPPTFPTAAQTSEEVASGPPENESG